MATERLVDTNVILRHILRDDADKSQASRLLFGRVAAGEETVWTTLTIVSEVVWVLSGRVYGHSREMVREAVEPLLALEHFEVDGKRFLRKAFQYWAELNISFIDALHASIVEQSSLPELYSFDRDFDRIPGITRIEPGT